MTVATLIAALQRVSNPHLPVVVRGPVREIWEYERKRCVDITLDYVQAVYNDGPQVVIYVAEHDR